jgi:DNA recombination-dependent growth factor C
MMFSDINITMDHGLLVVDASSLSFSFDLLALLTSRLGTHPTTSRSQRCRDP